MTPTEAERLLRTSKTEREWHANCSRIKHLSGGEYPKWWYEKIMASGLVYDVLSNTSQQTMIWYKEPK